MRVTLNLATRPFADLGPANKRLRIGMAVLALIAILLGLGLHLFHSKAEAARARDHSLDGQIARINQERQGYQDLMHQPANAQLLLHAQALNQLFEEKTFSWTLAMEDLETVLPGGVMVSTIEPVRAKDGHITLHLHVIGPRDKAVELVRNIELSKRFLFPRIVGENSESAGGLGEKLAPVSASNRVNFELLAEYNPASPEERKASAKHSQVADNSPSQPAPALAPKASSAHPGPASGPPQQANRQPYNNAPQSASPRPVPPQPAPPQSQPPTSGNSQPRQRRELTRRNRNHTDDPNAQPGGPQ